jgi:ACS family glucarate transporter-like MFS transporter
MRHRRRYLVYGLLFLLLVINYMDRTALSVAIIPIQHDLHLSPAMTGVVLSSFLWAYVLCVVPSGILVDRIGTRMTNTLSITVWSLATIATGFAGGLVALLSTRVVMGLGESATYPACGRITREWAPEGERGRATAIFNAGAYAGPAVGSLLAAWLLSQHGWHVMFWVMGVIGLAWLVPWLVWFRLPEHSRWLTNSERDHITAQRGTPARDAAPGAPALRALARQRTIWVLAIAQGTAGYTQYLFLTWLPSYLEHVHGLSVFASGTYSAIPYVAAVIGGVAIGTLSDRLLKAGGTHSGNRRIGVAACLLASSVVLAAPAITSTAGALAVISISLMFVATALTLNIALTNDLVRDQRAAGQANSIVILGGNTFGVLAPIITGLIVQVSGGYTAAFIVAGALLITGATLVLTLSRRPITITSGHPTEPSATPQARSADAQA